MGEKETATEERLDELYREHPEGFVAGRNELAKEVRAGGDREEADRIKGLRRPSAAAWLINRIALSSPEPLAEFAEASHKLEEAQTRALEGDEEAVVEWRAAVAREREASAEVIEAANAIARDAGHSVHPRALELVGETLQAAAGDADLRDRVMRGRLEREQSATTLGAPAGLAVPRREPRAAKRRERAQAKRELDRLEEELADATDHQEDIEGRIERLTETLRQEKARLADAKRATAALRRQVKAAKKSAKD